MGKSVRGTQIIVEQLLSLVNALIRTEETVLLDRNGGAWEIVTFKNKMRYERIFEAQSIDECELFAQGMLSVLTIKERNRQS